MKFVRPAPGARVRRPDAELEPIPATGAWVDERSTFWARRLRDGDVIEVDPSAGEKPGDGE